MLGALPSEVTRFSMRRANASYWNEMRMPSTRSTHSAIKAISSANAKPRAKFPTNTFSSWQRHPKFHFTKERPHK
jgi:hypothetical protein